MSLVPGQLAICVGDFEAYRSRCCWGEEVLPQKGRVYTIRETLFNDAYFERNFVRLVEIVNPARKYGFAGVCEIAFAASRFRPVVEDRIASLRSLLAPTPEHEDA